METTLFNIVKESLINKRIEIYQKPLGDNQFYCELREPSYPDSNHETIRGNIENIQIFHRGYEETLQESITLTIKPDSGKLPISIELDSLDTYFNLI